MKLDASSGSSEFVVPQKDLNNKQRQKYHNVFYCASLYMYSGRLKAKSYQFWIVCCIKSPWFMLLSLTSFSGVLSPFVSF